MSRKYVLYNPKANSGAGKETAKKVAEYIRDGEVEYVDIIELNGYCNLMPKLSEGDEIFLCGGDGTLNHFVNEVSEEDINRFNIYYFATGTGNDFLNDLSVKKEDGPVLVNKYMINLPTVTVEGKDYKFLNGVGFGIDGYCCEVGDEMRKTSDKPVNYTAIAIKGLLFHFKPRFATVTVDGVTKSYKKCWLAPTMNGRFYGGGMIPTPAQDRLNPERKISTMVYYGVGKLKALIVFPSIFKGEHVQKTKMVEVLEGYDITVTFDKPTAVQIDGETITGITSCHMKSARQK